MKLFITTKIASIDSPLRAGKFASLALFCGINDYKKNCLAVKKQTESLPFSLRSTSRSQICLTLSQNCCRRAREISLLPAAVSDYFRERMSPVTAFDFSESKKFTSNMWQVLRAYMYMSDPEATSKTHYVCQYSRPILNQDKLPSWCVLNGLEVGPG